MPEPQRRRWRVELSRVGLATGTIVDLGCGSGILARHLTDAGYAIVGFDVSDAMVAIARTHVPNAEFHVGSFVTARIPSCVGVAAIGEVLNYAFDDGNDPSACRQLFSRVHKALA
ncbi:MAG: class I SAM-dependent methyltransferase, partial [Vicinamibacterales bacterium]